MFPIENHIPLPKPGMGLRKYPWGKLEIGQSFLVPSEDFEREAVMNSLTSCRWNAELKSGRKNKKFALRRVKGGVRAWRVR